MRKFVLTFIFFGIFCSFLCENVFSQQNTEKELVDYTGTWASDYVNTVSTHGATFIHIEKMENNRYFVISFSNAVPIFTFIGGGFLRDDGFLQVKTDTGQIWLYTPAHVRGYDESLSMSNLDNVDSFSTFVRLDRKFTDWPFLEPIEK